MSDGHSIAARERDKFFLWIDGSILHLFFSFSLYFHLYNMSNIFKQLLQDAKELPTLSSKYDSPKLQHNLSQLDKETSLITAKINTASKDKNTLG